MTRFGWCRDGWHGACRGQFQTFYIEKGSPVITGTSSCDCPCHSIERKPRKKGW